MLKQSRVLSGSLTFVILTALACNFGGGTNVPAETEAAQPVEAILAATAEELAQGDATATNTPEGESEAVQEGGEESPSETPEPKPTDTQGPTNTPGAQGCTDGAQFVGDITIPDDTVFKPGDTFTKTWRIRNSGTCTWNSSYTYRFVNGDQLGGPASFPISGTVSPGAEVNLSVNLVAPTAQRTYKGGWRMHNPSNAAFGSTPFVQIIVASSTSTPTNTAIPTITSTPTQTATASATPTGVDLVVSSASVVGSPIIIYVAPQPANPTTTFNFIVRVKNIGTAGALGSFVDGLVQGSQKVLCLAPPLDAKNVVPLAPAEESADVNVSVDVVGYGSFNIEFSADYCGVIAENNEGNNTTIVTVSVS